MSTLERAVDKLLEAGTEPNQDAQESRSIEKGPTKDAGTEPKTSSLERASAERHARANIEHNQASHTYEAEKDASADSFHQAATIQQSDTKKRDGTASESDITPDWRHLETLGFITPFAGNSATIAEYRRIKRPLLTNVKSHMATQGQASRKNLIQVTSAREGEGKTFSALNLAMSIAAEMDQTVLLVDADVYRNDIAKLLGTNPSPGLADLLADPTLDIGQIIRRISGQKVAVITAGNIQPNNDELFASDRMKLVLAEIAERYSDRIVIIDSPPLLATSEAPVLLQLMGQVALVVSADTTPQQTVKEALDMIPKHVDIGLILNKASRHMTNDYETRYGYGYGYPKS